MKVTVLFFGATADSAGRRETQIALEENTRADHALRQICAEFPSLEQNHAKQSLLFAVNQEYADGSEIIKNGDELAVFTAVSGG